MVKQNEQLETAIARQKCDWKVTFEIVTPESAENGEAEESGFVDESCALREAVRYISGTAHEASDSRIASARWFTNYEYNEDYRTGGRESRSLHIPERVTGASRKRLARILGVRVH